MNHSKLYLQIHPKDNVLVALQDIKKGVVIEFQGTKLSLIDDVPAKHKFLIQDIKQGEDIIMYGSLVGRAIENIAMGGMITTENIKHAAAAYDAKKQSTDWIAPDVSKWKDKTFMGYPRADGQVGVRNYWLVIPLVFCENKNIEILRDAFLSELGFQSENPYRSHVRELLKRYQSNQNLDVEDDLNPVDHQLNRPFKNIDGIKFLTHQSGCGGTREDSENLCSLLAGYAVNPNVAGITVLSLGCQHAQIALIQEKLKEHDPAFSKPVLYFEQQKYGTEKAMLTAAIKETFIGLTQIDKIQRKPSPVSKLILGVKCGGSDGFSGISANPAVGHCSDLLVALGGRVIIAEFPELCGVEQELINRCTTQETAEKFTRLMKEYSDRAVAVGSGFDMNPSPGNIKDGLITDAIKSAGAAKKAGTSPIVDVIPYGKYCKADGLSLLCTPGNDVEATTGMAGAGCTIQLFTTGLGTPTGNPISPMVKLSTNNELYRKMPDIIDVNCGEIITGEKTIEQQGEEILDYVIQLASGELLTKAEEHAQDDFMFWKGGVSL